MSDLIPKLRNRLVVNSIARYAKRMGIELTFDQAEAVDWTLVTEEMRQPDYEPKDDIERVALSQFHRRTLRDGFGL